MRVVLDTNVLRASTGSRSGLRWLFDAVIGGRLGLFVSTEILLEYEEVLARKTTPAVADGVPRALFALPTADPVVPRFRWRLPPGDPDDETFVDALLGSGADALVTNDAHFGPLAALDVPLVHGAVPGGASGHRRRMSPSGAVLA